MRGRVSVTGALPQFVKNLLEFCRSRDYHADIDRPKLEELPKVIQVAIEKRVFIVPLYFQCDPAFHAIYFMCWSVEALIIDDRRCRVSLFFPA